MGGPRLLEMLKSTPSATLLAFSEDSGKKSQSVIFLVIEKEVVAAIAVADVGQYNSCCDQCPVAS